MANISLCMIAKDEESWIAQAIGSVRSIVSEIILVDTGSSDNTVEIAQGLGAQVYHMPWKDDFSAPRNFSLQYATGDWILILDADEVIAERDLRELVRLTEDNTRCIEFLQRHYSDDHRLSDFRPCLGEYPEWETGQGGYFESNCVRFFPNHAGIHYRGRVHELVEHSIREIGKHTIVRTPVRIHHYGHSAEVKKKKDKSRIYTPLGKAKTEEAPSDWKNFFELGVEHNNNGRLKESVAAFQVAAKLNPSYCPTWINMGYVLCELGAFPDAVRSLQNALKINPKEDEAYCNLGVVFMRSNNLQAAEQHFRQAIALNQYYVNAYCNLGICLAMNKRLAEAAAVYHRVIDLFPTCAKAHAELGALYLSAKVIEKSEHHLKKAISLEPSDARSCLHLGQLYRLLKRNIDAVAYLQRFCEIEHQRHGGNPSDKERALFEQVQRQCDVLTNEALLGQSAIVSEGAGAGVSPKPDEPRKEPAVAGEINAELRDLVCCGDFEEVAPAVSSKAVSGDTPSATKDTTVEMAKEKSSVAKKSRGSATKKNTKSTAKKTTKKKTSSRESTPKTKSRKKSAPGKRKSKSQTKSTSKRKSKK